MIYPADCFNYDFTVSAISFQMRFDSESPLPDAFNQFFQTQNDLVIRMGFTTLNNFNSVSWLQDSSCTEVFSGTWSSADFVFNNTTEGWLTVNFETPFTYLSGENLVVTIDENRDGMTSLYERFLCHFYPDQMGLFTGSMSANPDPDQLPTESSAIFRETALPNLRLTIDREMLFPEQPFPYDNSVDVPVNTNLQWFWNADAYDIYLGTDSDNLTLLAGDTSASGFDIPFDLDGSTDYYWQVQGRFLQEMRVGPIWSFTTVGETETIFSEDFETFPVYSDVGLPWTGIDGDNALTYGLTDWDFPGEGSAHSFFIIQPDQLFGFPFQAVTGTKCAASIAAVIPPNDDNIISPEIQFGEGAILSFSATSLTSMYGLERLRIMIYPEGNTENPVSLTEDNYLEIPDSWTSYQFDLSDWSNQPIRLGFCCCSYDALLLLLDNITVTGTTAIVEDAYSPPVPSLYVYPNPMNNYGRIRFKQPENENITLSIYDVKGRRIRDIYEGMLDRGDYVFEWNGCNKQKKKVSSGVYLLRLHSKKQNSVQKFIYLK
jgi:hypothetical protein